jgi:hypothetical protein
MDVGASQLLRKLWLRRFWIVLALLACLLQARSFSDIFQPLLKFGPDFYQDWASARNHLEGLPIYTRHEISIDHYHEALYVKPGILMLYTKLIEYNSWPPTSVLLALPLAGLDFADAFWIWTLASLLALGASLGIILWQCPIALKPWSILAAAVLLLWCQPFFFAVVLGQLHFFLLFLITASWAADRSQRPWLAGAVLGAATALKLAPGFLFLYFLIRRQWRALAAGAVAFLALTVLTVILLGPECYRDYITIVLPELRHVKWRAFWGNISLASFWYKMFHWQGFDNDVLLGRNASLSSAVTLLSDGLMASLTAWCVWRSNSLREHDLAFSLTVFAMLLVSPISWDHAITIAFLPLFLLWYWAPAGKWTRVIYWVILIMLWVPRYWVVFPFAYNHYFNYALIIRHPHVISLWLTYTFALAAMFVFTIFMVLITRADDSAPLPVQLASYSQSGRRA